MTPRRAALAFVLAALLGVTAATNAHAAITTSYPTATNARTFATTAGGWTSSVSMTGVCIIVCPTAAGSFQSTGGSGGVSDGYLRDAFSTGVGVAADSINTYTSPSFVVAGPIDTASLSVSVRTTLGGLLSIIGNSATLKATLVDVATPANSTVVGTSALANTAGFTPIQLTVPNGAIVAGRTYRLALAVEVDTGLVAVQASGTVDLDDVVLNTVDLLPPDTLTASASTSNGVSVSGGVDPHGVSTSVKVDYGTTTGYGASTTPVSVSGSGVQAFSIPIAGLTPGATYHYRVTAQNADGSTQTSDSTFIVPFVPANTPPTVQGALNATSRTAVYDVVTGTTSVQLEVLRGDGTVASTTADPDLDGSVAITLPSVDGSYGVRIIRGGAGGGSSTSSSTATSLDRVAPSTAGLGLTVVPTLSSSRTRAVSFVMPGDAVSATAQVLDAGTATVGSAVTAVGGAASVTLGAAEGVYRVRVTVYDAAGNAASVTSGDLTLDQTAPSAGSAPVVTGAANSRTRAVHFNRDPSTYSATVEVLDGGGSVVFSTAVPSGADASVTLPDTDGAFQVRVRQADAANNESVTGTTGVTLDRQPPAAGPAPTVTGLVSTRTRHVGFTRDASTASATLQILDTSWNVVGTQSVPSGGAADITLPDADADYDIRVSQADAAGNSAMTAATRVTLDRSAPSAGGAPTVTGASSSTTRVVTFVRDGTTVTAQIDVRDAGSAVVVTQTVASLDHATITLPGPDGVYHVTVTQTNAGVVSATSPARDIVLDRVAPDPGPAPTVTGAANVRARTVTFTRAPDAAVVAVEVVDTGGNVVSTTSAATNSQAITLPDVDGAYTVRVRQTDSAGNAAVGPTAAVTLDRVAPAAGGAPTVTGAGNARARHVGFDRDASTSSATIEVLDAGGVVVLSDVLASGAADTVTLPNTDGDYTVRVVQRDAAGNSAVSPATTVTLDRVAPTAGGAPSVTGASNVRTRTVTFTRDASTSVATLEVVGAGGTVVASTTVHTGATGDVVLPDSDGAYDVRVRQADSAGNESVTATTGVTLDRVAPAAGPAPSLTGAANVRSRTVGFTRDASTTTATIEVLDGNGAVVVTKVAAGASDTVTLPDGDGTYTVRVRQADAAGNESVTATTTVTLDRVAPAAGRRPR